MFDIEVVTYRPQGSITEELIALFLGGAPQLRNEELVYSGTDKYRLKTITTGKVFIQLSVLLKDFGKYGLNW